MRRAVWQFGAILTILGTGLGTHAEDAVVVPAPVAQPASEAPASATAPTNVPDLSGTWTGTWQSCVNGHHGPMNATFCRRCDGHYDVAFNGRFWKLIPFRYKTTLTVTGYGTNGKVYLSGSHHLGPVLGTFSYNAWADGGQFVSGYCARKDNGQFVMSRSCR